MRVVVVPAPTAIGADCLGRSTLSRVHPIRGDAPDMLVFGDDRTTVEGWAKQLEVQASRLRLRLHPWEVRPTRAGVSFPGFRILPTEVRVRRSSVKPAERRLSRKRAQRREAGPNPYTPCSHCQTHPPANAGSTKAWPLG